MMIVSPAMPRLRFAAAALLLVLALCAGRPLLAETAYVPGTEDVPLMPGLTATGGGPLVFDKPQGRIVEATATGAVKRAQVLAFYRSSLPELGWSRNGDAAFKRAGEELAIDFKGRDGALTVSFTLAPN